MSGECHIVLVSGGKDSVATWLFARRTLPEPPIAAYEDTGWEWDGHHKHLDLLEARIGPLHRIGPTETFAEAVERKGTFPSRVRKWCTEELKLEPFKRWLDEHRASHRCEPTLVLGERRDESARRAAAKEREYSAFYQAELWRPILDWTVEDVIAEHRRAAIPMHPLYHLGAERVGCFPCVNAGKAELALVAELMPERIDKIRELERRIGQTMFTRDRRTEKRRNGDDGPSVVPIGIDEVIAWARTARGGRQLELVRMPTGCMRWACDSAPDGARAVRR